MARRAQQARVLAEYLTEQAHTPVTIIWDNPSGRPSHGVWRVEWTDGPTTAALRALAATHARFVRPLDIATLHWSRQYTPTVWAAALLTRAQHGTLPDTAAQAAALVEYDLPDTDTTTWTPAIRRAATDLAHRHHGNPRQIAAALLANPVTKPRNETPPLPTAPTRCAQCSGALPTPATTGRPPRWCSPACRQADHRRRNTVTKPRNETPCPACGRPITTPATGRPARWCSPACRTRAWRDRNPTST